MKKLSILKQKLYLITELCEAGELAKWIKKQGHVPEHISKIIMRQIVDAISYLHKNGLLSLLLFNTKKVIKNDKYLDIVHRDLKLENILIKEFDTNFETFYIKVNFIFLQKKIFKLYNLN